MAVTHHRSSFSSLKSYGQALIEIPKRFINRAGSVSSSSEEKSRVRAQSGQDMHKSLRWFDLVGFGIGGMVGAGVFVTTGRASNEYAGPAVILSYAIAGLCALLSAFCYTEFAVDMPVAGGAFSYLRITFGEFAAYITGANLVMEYVLSNAAVSRSFTAYLGTAIGISSTDKWRIIVPWLPKGFNQLDFIAVTVILLISLCICYSTRESSVLNMVLTFLHIVFIAFIIVLGFWKGESKNFTEPSNPLKAKGFFPYGISGVFNGAAIVYLSYIGYDAVSTMAEEVQNPIKDIPIGVSGSVVIVTIFYCLMATSMSRLVPYDAIDIEAPFSSAFKKSDGWGWISNVVGGGASFGILTSLVVAMLGQARYLCVIGRSNIVPAWFAKVHPKTSTPVNASAFLGLITATIALFTDFDILLNLVSIGTLFVFYMVANAVIFRRYVTLGTTNPWPTLSFLFTFSSIALAFTLLSKYEFPPTHKIMKTVILCVLAVIMVIVIQAFCFFVPQTRKPEHWGVPLMPWIPSFSIFLNLFLLGALDAPSYERFGYFSAVLVLFYLLYSLHASFDAAEGSGNSCFSRRKYKEVQRSPENADDLHEDSDVNKV